MINGTRIKLREKKTSDARDDYSWQTDPELARLDATIPLAMSYSRYLLDYSLELRVSPSRHRLAIDTLDGRHIGNCSYYDVDADRKEAQLGIMIGDRDYWNQGYGADAVNTLVDHIFLETKLDRIYLKTLSWNRRAQHCFEKCGFRKYDQLSRGGYHFILMEIFRRDWKQHRQDTTAADSSQATAGPPVK
jgi:RimJ/RimL family protein N-acetyltransferase